MRFLKSIKGKRKLFALLLHDATVFHLVNKMMPARLAVLNYHRLKPDDPKFRPIYDDDIFGPTASEFEKQLRWLKEAHPYYLGGRNWSNAWKPGNSRRSSMC